MSSAISLVLGFLLIAVFPLAGKKKVGELLKKCVWGGVNCKEMIFPPFLLKVLLWKIKIKIKEA